MQPSGAQPSGIKRSGSDGEAPGSSAAAKKFVPIVVAVLAVIGIVAAVVLSGGDDDQPKDAATTTAVPKSGATSLADLDWPEGVVPFPVAKAAGTEQDIDWGDRCDTERGLVALPLFSQQDCFAPFKGDNGGATSTGVTADEIKVVVYLTQPNDPVLKFIYQQINNDDTVDQIWETYQSFNEMFARYYETYGRKVKLVRYDATGSILDSVAAVADAEAIAAMEPFMVLNGPNLTNAFADTLAARRVMCISCTPGQPNDWYEQRAPYVWDIQKNPTQNQQLSAEYIGKRLAGRPAEFAGDDALKAKERVFGYIRVVGSDSAQALEDAYVAELAKYDVEFARIETYATPTELAGTGRDIISRMKEAGVTSVVFAGDPLAPQTLTTIATDQQFFPEWVITGTVLVDTTAFSRTYDQKQWAHAFGPSNLFARVDPAVAGGAYLHNWYYGQPAPADQTLAVLIPNLQFLYNPLPGAGPTLTPQRVQDLLFSIPAIASTPSTPQVSYGNRGFFPGPDYAALDDQVEVWWDATATGVDELGRQGTGMWRYVDGGKRFLPGQWPESEPVLFDPAGTVTVLDEPPAAARLPDDYVPVK